jgi:hypothetical protein
MMMSESLGGLRSIEHGLYKRLRGGDARFDIVSLLDLCMEDPSVFYRLGYTPQDLADLAAKIDNDIWQRFPDLPDARHPRESRTRLDEICRDIGTSFLFHDEAEAKMELKKAKASTAYQKPGKIRPRPADTGHLQDDYHLADLPLGYFIMSKTPAAQLTREIKSTLAGAPIEGRQPLYGHTSEATAYLVDDYPYGFTPRAQIRYWLEHKPKKGWRFVSQTKNPKTGAWNKPKASTYADWGGAMYLDDNGHVQWEGVGPYTDDAKMLAFVTTFPKSGPAEAAAFERLT